MRTLRRAGPVLLWALLPLTALPAAPVHASPAPARYSVYLPITNPAAPTVAPVTASAGRGVYDAPLDVTLSTGTAGATIYYTLDGTVPAPENGFVYEAPLRVDKTTVLRARATHPRRESSAVLTASYIFPADVAQQPTRPTCARAAGQPPCFPETWGRYPNEGPSQFKPGQPVPADYAMDPDVVGPYAAELGASLKSLPSVSLVTAPEDMFDASRGIYADPLASGSASERPASVELILPDGRPGFQVDCGVRIAGVWSRRPDVMSKHSFSIRFSSRYGPKKLHYRLFPDSSVDSFDSFRLRAGQADTFNYSPQKAQFVHDQWGRDTQRDMGWASPHGRFVHLYVDGLYWGLFNLTEETTAEFAASYLGGEPEDWDVIKEGHEVEDGNLDAYNTLLALKNEGPVTPERYERMQQLLDVTQFADYNLIEIFGANQDWPHNNWRAVRNRVAGDGFQFLVWDIEQMVQLNSYDLDTSIAATPGVDELQGWLKGSPDYRLLFADRVQRHLFGDGALSPAANWRRYESLAGSVRQAVVAESARWGDVVPAPRAFRERQWEWCRYLVNVCDRDCDARSAAFCPQTRDAQWQPEHDRLQNVFFPQRTGLVLQQLCGAGLYPDVVPPIVSDSVTGGSTRGTRITLVRAVAAPGCAGARADGDIYFTLNGSDPREPGTGRVSPLAQVYHGPLAVGGHVRLVARAAVPGPDGLTWSTAVHGTFGNPRLAISEIMYHPPAGDGEEFIEFENLERFEVDLSGMVTRGITFTMPAGTLLPPGAHLVLAADADAFAKAHPHVPLGGEYDGKLSDKGERIELKTATGMLVAAVDYDEEGLWPLAPDGLGHSLVPVDALGDPSDPDNWRASTLPGGSPGLADPPPPYQPVIINEVLPRASAPFEPAIELYNPGPSPARVAGWGLSDDLASPLKFRLPPGPAIAPGGYLVVYATRFQAGSGSGPGFELNPAGGTVYLTSTDGEDGLTGLLIGGTYGPADDGRSFGRIRTSVRPDFVALAAPTFGVDHPTSPAEFRAGTGAANAGPWVAPVVVNEIMYHPAGDRPEYLELHNTRAQAQLLGDPTLPTRGWQLAAGVTYAFPPGTSIPADGYLVVAAGDADAARRAYDIPAEVPVLGPFSGKLDNSGERLAVTRPVIMPDGSAPDGLVEAIRYGNAPPWRSAADGSGAALERIDPAGYGDEPNNWSALSANGTAGRPNTPLRRTYLPVVASRW